MSRMLARDTLRLFAPATSDAPTTLAAAHRIRARQHLSGERYKQCRHHARAALACNPADAAAMLDLAAAWENDPYGSDEKAFQYYRRAVKLDRSNALAYALLARCAVRVQRDGLARKALTRAVRLAPANASVLNVILEACREAKWLTRAWKLIVQARFLAPHDSQIQSLWNRVRFERAANGQRSVEENCVRRVLPFLRISGL